MTSHNNQSRLFITGGEWLYQLEIRGLGDGSILAWRTRTLDPHTRHPTSELYKMTDSTAQSIGLSLEDSWLQHLMVAGECGHTLPMIQLDFDEVEF